MVLTVPTFCSGALEKTSSLVGLAVTPCRAAPIPVFVISPARSSLAGGAIPGGHDVITDFQVGEDVLEFTWGINSLADLSFATVGNDTVISFGNNGVAVTLVGVGLDQLMAHAAHDFLFV